ncbi:MAG TPA: DUF4175 family protein [Vicinamibacterales bacterium]
MSADRLRPLLDGVRRRWRAQGGLRLAGRAALAASAPLAAAVVAARFIDLSDRALALLVAVALAAAVAAVILTLKRTAFRPFGDAVSDGRLARFIEERTAALSAEPSASAPAFDDVLVSAVDGMKDSSQRFHAAVVDSAARKLEAVGASRIVPPETIRRAGLEALGGFAVLVVAVAFAAPLVGRVSETAWIALFPRSVQLEILPGDARVVSGQPLAIRAIVRVRGSALTRFVPRLTVLAGTDERSVPMTSNGDGFQFAFESIDRSFRYRVAAGSASSREYTVTALHAPRVERIDLRYDYPAFTKLQPRDESDGGDVYAPAGTAVRVRVHTDKPIASGSLALGGASTLPLARTGDRQLEGTLVLSRDDSYRVALEDADNLRSKGDTEYFIRIMDDRPPDVRIVRPLGDQQITPLEEVAIEARADDDHGIARFELVYAVAGRAPKVVPLAIATGTEAVKAGTYLLAAEDLRVQPGDVITYYARARDVGRGKRPSETRSDMLFLEVRPFSEEFVNAQSQAAGAMAGDQIDTLIAAQKEIINATWNIERRAAAGAGKSTSDITAIADAQAELKGRAEQIVSRGVRTRGAFRLPQQIAPSRQLGANRPAADPVGAAISAMGRAVGELQGQRTGDALTHEMAALQGLLQAQAEIRRREISQQSGAAGGGLGRQGQDLSALFDKELQRQQRTNYETRSQLETTPDRENESALDRIRDLARRQEELSRRQRELANSALPPDEVKRRLEQLTRDQSELRERADEIAKQTGQQGEGSGMRGVSEQMRSAASDLQRQDPGAAADRADRAAAQLRRLEEQLRRDGPEARQRAAGELRLEAQQIADEQRRIAGEAGRLEKGTADRDAWRRLAGEKEKLADRVDDLQRAAEQLSAGDRTGGQDAAREQTSRAARELSDQKIADRMRETAKQIREANAAATGGRGAAPAPRRGTADAEQQMARALDRVIDRLNGTDASADELSRELSETRAARERLDRLERNVRDAEAKNAAARAGGNGSRGNSSASEDLQRAREEYAKEMQRTRETLSRLERSAPGSGQGGTSPENHEWSVTDQGTEAFKQDFSKWESLRKEVDSAMERYEASIVARAARKSLQDRLNAGGSDRVPDEYRKLIARYYESLARKK